MEKIKTVSFLEFLSEGLAKHTQAETEKNLGNRAEYIGGSDLGLCPRKAILSKINPQPASLKENIIFQRGHLAEAVIENALKAKGVKYSTQVRVESKEKTYFKAHLDFLVHGKNEDVMLEIKTVTSIPQAPRESWILQVQYGLGLLREQGGNCERGYIVCFEMNSGEHKVFDFTFDQDYYSLAKERGERLYALLSSAIRGENPEMSCETSPLCSFCSYSKSCKHFGEGAVQMSSEIEEELENYKQQLDVFKHAKAEKEKTEKALIAFMQSAELGKVKCGDNTILLKNRAGRTTIDTKMLQVDHPDLFSLYSKKCEDSQYLMVV